MSDAQDRPPVVSPLADRAGRSGPVERRLTRSGRRLGRETPRGDSCSRLDLFYSLIVVALGLLLLLPALVSPSGLLYPSWSDYSDLTLIHWPKVMLVRETLAAGQGLPLWAPYQLSGQPLAANQLAMLFYPPALLLAIPGLPLPWALSLFAAVHLAWAGLGTYWLARGLGRRPEAALLAGAILALSGKLAAHVAIGHASLVPALAWAPWAFAFLHRALVGRSVRWAVLAGVALAAQAVTHTYALVYTAYGLLAYTGVFLVLAPLEQLRPAEERAGGQARPLGASRGVRWHNERVRLAAAHLARLVVVPIVAVALGAAQLLPLAELAGHSNRALSLAEATTFSLPPLQMLTGLLFPTPNVGHELVLYPGLLTAGLAAGAVLLVSKRRPWREVARREWPLVALSLLVPAGLILAVGSYTPAYGVAYRLLPGLSWVRTPARLMAFVTLGLAVLAAYGVESWAGLSRRSRAWRVARLAVLAALVAGLALGLGAVFLWRQAGRGAWGLAAFGVLSGALLLWGGGRDGRLSQGKARRLPRPLFAWLAVLVVGADLFSFDWTTLRVAPLSTAAAAGQAPAGWLAAQFGLFRTYSPSYSLPQPAVSSAGLELIDGVEPVHVADYDRFMATAAGYGPQPFSVTIPPFASGVPNPADPIPAPDLALLGLLNGRYLASAAPLDVPGLALRWQDGTTWIYENGHALPRAWVVYRTEGASRQAGFDAVLARLRAVDLTQVALVEGGPALPGAAATPGEGGLPAAQVIEATPNRLVVQAEAAAPAMLVVSEIWYPGWKALDNGQPAPVERVDGLLRGVKLGPGSTHRVELRYDPWTVRAGVAVAAGTTFLLLAAVVTWLARRVRR